MPNERPVAKNLIAFLTDPDGLRLKEPLEAEEAARRILALYEESGREGATLNLRFGNMSDQPLYSVSVYPERELKLPGSIVESDILQLFIKVNLDLLGDPNDPRCGVGLWYNADADVTYCDIVAVLPNRQEAIDLAAQYDQLAIFDLHTLTEIETGGAGNTPADMPPVSQRLPKINSEEEHL